MRDRAPRGLSTFCSLRPSWEEQNMHKLMAGSDAAQQRSQTRTAGEASLLPVKPPPRMYAMCASTLSEPLSVVLGVPDVCHSSIIESCRWSGAATCTTMEDNANATPQKLCAPIVDGCLGQFFESFRSQALSELANTQQPARSAFALYSFTWPGVDRPQALDGRVRAAWYDATQEHLSNS